MKRHRLSRLFLVPLGILVPIGFLWLKCATGFPPLPARIEAFIGESGMTRLVPQRVMERAKLKMYEHVRKLQRRQDRLDAEVEAGGK